MSQPPYPGQPNPDEPSSVPPQPGYPPTTPYPTYGEQQPPAYGQQPPAYGQQPPPGYGEPQWGQQQQPAYGDPQYGQQQPPPVYPDPVPGFAPPGYPQQGYPQQPGYPAAGFPQPPKKKSRALPITLVSIGVVLVLCIGGGIAIGMAVNNNKDKIDDALADSTSTAAPRRTTAAPAAPDPKIQIIEPKTLGGRPKLTSGQFAGIAEELQKGLKSVPGATGSVGALYGSQNKQNIVILAGAEAPIDNPDRELDEAFVGVGTGGLKIKNITDAPTGELGGSAKCGSARTSGIDVAICSWADSGSLGMFIWYFKSVTKAKAEFPKLRAQVEKKA
jgi:hypothetical protein